MKEKDLENSFRKWNQTIVSNNAEESGTFMSDDWVCVGTDSGLTPKSSFLELIRSGDLIHTRMDSDEMRVRIYDNTGVVVSKGTSAGTYRGDPFSLYEWSTSVFIMEDNRWVCVLTMLTPVTKN